MTTPNPFETIPPTDSEDPNLGDEICTLCAQINVATYHLLRMIAQFDEQGLYASEGCLTTAHWLQYRCSIASGAAREKVRVARALQSLPVINQAFADGTLSYSKARALTRAATQDNEADLLNIAQHSTAAQTERILKDYRQTCARHDKALQLTSAGFKRLADQTLSCYWNESGELVLKATLTADQGALLLQAMAQVESQVPAEGDDVAEPAASRRAQALVMLAERSMAASDVSASSADRFQVGVHIPVQGANQTQGPARIEHGPVLSRIAAERLLCDASVVTYVEDDVGQPLNVGRKTRVVSPALRRALQRRDGGCRFPGCSQRRFVDAHHIQHWAHGGDTKLTNLVLLCRFHHRLMHEGGFRVHRGDGDVQFYRPDGTQLPNMGERLPASNVLPFPPRVSAETPVDARSLTPKLDHKPPDYHHICWVLTQHLGY